MTDRITQCLNPDLIIPEGAIPCGESILCGRDAEFHHTTQMVMNPKPDELLSILNDARIIALPGWKSIVTMKCDIALCKQHNEEFVRGQQVLKEWNNADPEGS